jgi:phosphonate transport system substrate-binding protein
VLNDSYAAEEVIGDDVEMGFEGPVSGLHRTHAIPKNGKTRVISWEYFASGGPVLAAAIRKTRAVLRISCPARWTIQPCKNLMTVVIMDFRRFALQITSILFGLSLLLPFGQVAAQQPPLRMALIPYLSPNILVPLFQPLATHLEKDIGRPVDLYTAPSIRSHVERILKPDFDIIFTAPHMGRLSQLDAGYVPIGSFERPLKGIITVRSDGPIDDVRQLKGRTVAINDRLVLNSILTLQELEKHGINPSELNVVPAASQNSAILSVIAGDVDAAITVNFALGLIPKDQLQKVRVLLQTGDVASMPSTLILVHPLMPKDLQSKLKASLLRFAKTDEGKQFLASSSYNNVVPANPEHVKNLDIYLPELRRLLAIKPGN